MALRGDGPQSGTAGPEGYFREEDIDVVTAGIAEGTRRAGRRLVVGGAAPLRIPGTSWSALEDPVRVPRRFRAFAASSSRQLESPTTSRGILSIGR